MDEEQRSINTCFAEILEHFMEGYFDEAESTWMQDTLEHHKIIVVSPNDGQPHVHEHIQKYLNLKELFG